MDDKKKDNSVSLARAISPEDIRPQMYLALLSVVSEHLPLYLFADDVAFRQPAIFRVQWMPCCDPQPMKVQEVCLPFVFVKRPDGALRTLDVRRHRLARLDDRFGKRVFKMLKEKAKKARQDRNSPLTISDDFE